MADQTLAALRELTEAVMAEFFGNDTNLSKRLIAATNEAQLLLMAQPPNDDLANHPAPVKPGLIADTAAAMLVAVRSAQLSNQPLAVGLADALEELVDRTADECDSRKIANVVHEATIQSIINHLRNTNHA